MPKLNKSRTLSTYSRGHRLELLKKMENIKIESNPRKNQMHDRVDSNSEANENLGYTTSSKGNKLSLEQNMSTVSHNVIKTENQSNDDEFKIIKINQNSPTYRGEDSCAENEEELIFKSNGTNYNYNGNSININYDEDLSSDSDDEESIYKNRENLMNIHEDGGSSTESSDEVLVFRNNQHLCDMEYSGDSFSDINDNEEEFVFKRNQNLYNMDYNDDLYSESSDDEFTYRNTHNFINRSEEFRNYKDTSNESLCSEYFDVRNSRERDTIVGPLRVTGSFTVIDTAFNMR